MTEKEISPDNCLNCGTRLTGRFCQACGQDSAYHPDSIWHLLQHFFSDITHYDSKFWKTILPLLIKPGFLTEEYQKGKRTSYINPVRLFIFLNFALFLLIAWLPSNETTHGKSAVKFTTGDSTDLTIAKYDSLQNALPVSERDGKLEKKIKLGLMQRIEKMKGDPSAVKHFSEKLLHNTAKLTFFFLLICACMLYLVYIRRRLLMVNHALFAIHLACTFLLLSVFMVLVSYLPFGDLLQILIFLYGNYYLFRALLLVYKQSLVKTTLKFVLIELMLFITLSVAVIIDLLWTVFSVTA